MIIYNLIKIYSYLFFIRRRKEILLLFNSAAEGYGPQNILLLLEENKKENILLLIFCSRERERICRGPLKEKGEGWKIIYNIYSSSFIVKEKILFLLENNKKANVLLFIFCSRER